MTQNSKSKESHQYQRQQGKTSLIQGGVIVLLITLSPFLFYLYKSFPEGDLWKTSFFEIKTAYGSWFNTAWYITGKIVPIYLLLIWFFTCKHWWHWIILLPISMYIFQLWNVWNVAIDVDEMEMIYIFPLMMILVPIVYLLRAKLFARVRGNDLEQFEEELGQKRTIWQQITDLFR